MTGIAGVSRFVYQVVAILECTVNGNFHSCRNAVIVHTSISEVEFHCTPHTKLSLFRIFHKVVTLTEPFKNMV